METDTGIDRGSTGPLGAGATVVGVVVVVGAVVVVVVEPVPLVDVVDVLALPPAEPPPAEPPPGAPLGTEPTVPPGEEVVAGPVLPAAA
ncbi:MAG: hypothetical protein ACRD0J_18060, partial [Acidimicrobiales bacterium]